MSSKQLIGMLKLKPKKKPKPKKETVKQAEVRREAITKRAVSLLGKKQPKILEQEVPIEKESTEAEKALAEQIEGILEEQKSDIEKLKKLAKMSRKERLEYTKAKETVSKKVGEITYKTKRGRQITRPLYKTPTFYYTKPKTIFRAPQKEQLKLFRKLEKEATPSAVVPESELAKTRRAKIEEEMEEMSFYEKPKGAKEIKKIKEQELEAQLELKEGLLYEEEKEAESEEEIDVPLTAEAVQELDRKAEEAVDIEEEKDDEPTATIPEEIETEETDLPLQEEEPSKPSTKMYEKVKEMSYTMFAEKPVTKTRKFGQHLVEIAYVPKLKLPEITYEIVQPLDVLYESTYTFMLGAFGMELPIKDIDRSIVVLDSDSIRKRKPRVGGSYFRPIMGVSIATKTEAPFGEPVPSISDLLEAPVAEIDPITKEPIPSETRSYVREYIQDVMNRLVVGSSGIVPETLIEKKRQTSKIPMTIDAFKAVHFGRFRAMKIRERLNRDKRALLELTTKMRRIQSLDSEDIARDYFAELETRYGTDFGEDVLRERLSAIRPTEKTLFDIVVLEYLNRREISRYVSKHKTVLPEIPDITTVEGQVASALHYFRVKHTQATEKDLLQQLENIKKLKYSDGRFMYKLTPLERAILKYLKERVTGSILYAKELKGAELVELIRNFIRRSIIGSKRKDLPQIRKPKKEIKEGYNMIVLAHELEAKESSIGVQRFSRLDHKETAAYVIDVITRYIETHQVAIYGSRKSEDIFMKLTNNEVSRRLKEEPLESDITEFDSKEEFVVSRDVKIYGGKDLNKRYEAYVSTFSEPEPISITKDEYRELKRREFMLESYIKRKDVPKPESKVELRIALNTFLERNLDVRDAWNRAFDEIILPKVDAKYKIIEEENYKVERSTVSWRHQDVEVYEQALYELHKDSTNAYLNESSIHIAILNRDSTLGYGFVRTPGHFVRERLLSGRMKLADIVGMPIEELFIEVFMNSELGLEDVDKIKRHLALVGTSLTYNAISYIAAKIYPTSRIRITNVYPMIVPDPEFSTELDVFNLNSYAIIPQNTCVPKKIDIPDGELVLIRAGDRYECFSFRQLFYLIKMAGEGVVTNPYTSTPFNPEFIDSIKRKYATDIEAIDISKPVHNYVVMWNKRQIRQMGKINTATGERIGTWIWYREDGTKEMEKTYSQEQDKMRIDVTKWTEEGKEEKIVEYV